MSITDSQVIFLILLFYPGITKGPPLPLDIIQQNKSPILFISRSQFYAGKRTDTGGNFFYALYAYFPAAPPVPEIRVQPLPAHFFYIHLIIQLSHPFAAQMLV